jgi:hypothetical protein
MENNAYAEKEQECPGCEIVEKYVHADDNDAPREGPELILPSNRSERKEHIPDFYAAQLPALILSRSHLLK